MIILGIDPGTTRVGYGILKKEGSSVTLVAYGSTNTPSKTPKDQKLLLVQKTMDELIITYAPDVAAVEKLFFEKNKKTMADVSEARGVIIGALAARAVPVAEYTPLQVKQAITGYGRAEKLQIQKMVQAILKMKEMPKPDDAADALATAICHASFMRE